MKKNDGKKRNWDILFTFLIVFIIKEIFVLFFAEPLRTPMDEMSTIVNGAYFAGLDWTGTTTYAKFYYGGGFTALFAPIFKLTDNPYIIYSVILSGCALIQSVGAPISNYIFRKYFHMERKISFVASLACGFFVCTRAMVVYNEHGLIFAAWIIALIVCKLLEYEGNKRKKQVYSVLLMAMICYSFTFHTRAKTFLYALIVLVALFYFVYKKMLVSPICAIVSGTVFYACAEYYIDFMKRHVWEWHEGMKLNNTSIDFYGLEASDLFSPITWETWVNIIVGQLNTVTVFTGGIAVIMLVLLCVCLYGVMKKRIVVLTNKENNSGDVAEKITFSNELQEKLLFAIALIFLMCVGATILTQSITWLKRAAVALEGAPYGTNAYGYKAFTYIRYMAPYLGPVFMMGLICIFRMKEQLKKYILPSGMILFFLHAIWLAYVLPHITKNRVACEVFAVFGGYSFWENEQVRIRVYIAGSIVMLMVALICFLCFYRKNVMVPTVVIFLLLLYQYSYGAYFIDAGYNNKFSNCVDGGYSFVKQLEENAETAEWFPKTIYAVDSNKSVQKFVYTYQFMLNRYNIVPGVPENVEEAIVFTTDKSVEKFRNSEYRIMKLDDNEYLCVLGEKYVKYLEKTGYVLE